MKILSSNVAFNSQYQKEITEGYQLKQTSQSNNSGSSTALNSNAAAGIDFTELSYAARMRSDQSTNIQAESTITTGSEKTTYEQSKATQSIIQTTIGFGVRVSNIRLTENSAALLHADKDNSYLAIEPTNNSTLSTIFETDKAQPARIEISELHTYKEKEQLHVGSQGTVTTADGQKIDFMMHLDMRREFSLEQSLEIESGKQQIIDPLIINLEGGTASLTTNSFSFDLNTDGINEEISFVGQGSGFLVFDQNNDGKINNGAELFGTGELNGFADLAKYDDDDNKWIDESDAIFEKLTVWKKNENGDDQLIRLKEAGVGAIYLGSSTGSFDLTDTENNLLGQVKRSGVFLTEKGEVASIQELDLAIRENSGNSIVNNETIKNSIGKIQQQKEEMISLRIAAQPNSKSFSSQFNFPDQSQHNEKEDKKLTLMDLLFPKQSTNTEIREQEENTAYKSESIFEKISHTQSTFKATEEKTIPNTQTLFEIDKATLTVMKELEEKTIEKVRSDQDSYSNLKAMIKFIADQTHSG